MEVGKVHAERDRLLPLRAEATRTTIEMVRTRSEDELFAFALSLANLAVAAVVDLAKFTELTTVQPRCPGSR
ncbi:hypothetical protein AB5J72_30625 [Streptomyces sp. CG1]|uniref:hypothetical protein n=1 Tax=Streptomyces sp. CG1 TaxID=1287523 RepID=UPI0034E1D2B5